MTHPCPGPHDGPLYECYECRARIREASVSTCPRCDGPVKNLSVTRE